jgi:hypothetical protein
MEVKPFVAGSSDRFSNQTRHHPARSVRVIQFGRPYRKWITRIARKARPGDDGDLLREGENANGMK